MKYSILFLIFLSSSVFACVEESSLYGESIYKGENPETVYRKVEDSWNANSEIYDTLYLKAKSKPTTAKLILTKNNKTLFTKAITIKSSNKSKTYAVESLNFKNDLVARNQDFPFSAKIEYVVGDQKLCTQTIKFMVTE